MMGAPKAMRPRTMELVEATFGIGGEHAADFVPHAAEDGQLLLVGANGLRRVVEAPMMTVQLAGEQRTGLIGIAADGDHGFHRLLQKVVHVLGVMRGNINANFLHHLNAERMHIPRRLRASAVDIKNVARDSAQDAFGEMAAARIAGAENEHSGFHFLDWRLHNPAGSCCPSSLDVPAALITEQWPTP